MHPAAQPHQERDDQADQVNCTLAPSALECAHSVDRHVFIGRGRGLYDMQCKLVLQSDGELVLMSLEREELAKDHDVGGRQWSSKVSWSATDGGLTGRLVLEDDGHLVIYDGKNGHARWTTRTPRPPPPPPNDNLLPRAKPQEYLDPVSGRRPM